MTWLRLWSSSTKDESCGRRCSPRRVVDQANKSPDEALEAASLGLFSTTSAGETTSRNVFTEPETIGAALALTAAILGSRRIYKRFLKRIPEAVNIKSTWLGKRSILGKVTSVGDGDNFRIYHTPGGWLAGWGWLPWRRVPTDKAELKNKTIHIRLAGIDAPELAHFGNPAQPYGQEALDWLTAYVQRRRIRAYVLKADQYRRVVATAYVWKGFLRRDIGLQMLRAGYATVYEAKTGVVFGEGLEEKYRKAQWWAKLKRKGMWAGKKQDFESPRAYKIRHSVGAPVVEEAASKK